MDMDEDEYAGAPPRMVIAEQTADAMEEAAAALSLEERFAAITAELMRDEVEVPQALLAFKEASAAHVDQLRERASSLLHRSAHYLQARQLADELEAQGATWELLLHLYGMGEQPAGLGGPPVPGSGGRQTYRQALRAAVNGDPTLERVGHVVAWLESLAAQRLEAAPPLGFSASEGVWRETLLLARAGGGGGGGAGGSELDPDAPARGAAALRGEDQRNEERLAATLFALLRAGKLRQAQELCRRCGQDWRAAALAGGGQWGPLPVGGAAADADEDMEEEWQAEDLADEVERGRGPGRALWRWSCAAAADAAAAATPSNRWEAALFGALSGHVSRVLPVCGGWEDEAWAYCRAWLDLGADEAAAAASDGSRAEFGGRDQGEAHGVPDAHVIPSDLLASLLEDAASSGYTRAANPELLQEGLAVAGADGGDAVAKLQRLRREGDRALVPTDFDDLRALLSSNTRAGGGGRAQAGGAAGRAAAPAQQRTLQLHIMAARWRDLVYDLAGAALAAHEAQRASEAARWAAGAVGVADAAAGGPPEAGGVLRRSGDPGFALLRFAAHVALVLRALGLVKDPRLIELQARAHGMEAGLSEEEEQEEARLQEVLGKVVYQYADALAAHPASWPLVPPYLCHLREAVRAALLARLVRAAGASSAGDEACLALHSALSSSLEAWRAREQLLEEAMAEGRMVGDPECAPTSLLSGDVRPGELRSLLASLMSASRAGAADGPAARARLLRWLFYPFVAAERAAAAGGGADVTDGAGDVIASGGGGGGLRWDPSWGDALHHAVGLATEFALSPAPTARALAAVMEDAVPEGFIEAAEAQLQEWEGDPVQQDQLLRQLMALAFWRDYASLDSEYCAWKASPGAAPLSGDASAGDAYVDLGHDTEAAAARGEALAERLLDLAAADALAPLVEPAADGPGAGGIRLMVVAAGGGGEDDYQSSMDARALQRALEPALAALSANPDVDARASLPGAAGDDDDLDDLDDLEPDRNLDLDATIAGGASVDELLLRREERAQARRRGVVVVRIRARPPPPPPPGAPAHEAERLRHKALRAWEAAAAKAAWLAGGGGGGKGEGGGGGGGAAPRLVVVSLGATFSTAAQIARHRTTAKLLTRAAKVLLALTRIGHFSAPLSARLVELAAGAGAPAGAPSLADLLAPRDARRLLRLVAASYEDAPPGPGAVLV